MKKMVMFTVMLVMAILIPSIPVAHAKTQLEVLQEQAADSVKFGLQDLDTLRTEVNKMKRRFGALTKVDIDLGNKIKTLEAQILEMQLTLKRISGPSPEIPGILSRIEKLEKDGGVINGRLDKIEKDVEALKKNDKVQDDRLDAVEQRLDRGLGIELGMGAYGVYGTNGVLVGGLMLTLNIPVYSDFAINLAGGIGGMHEGASGFADVSFRYVSSRVSVGLAVGIDANCDGLCTRLTTEMWGAGPDVEIRFADDLFIRGRVLFGSEWVRRPTIQIEYDDRTVFKTDDSREFGISAGVALGYWF